MTVELGFPVRQCSVVDTSSLEKLCSRPARSLVTHRVCAPLVLEVLMAKHLSLKQAMKFISHFARPYSLIPFWSYQSTLQVGPGSLKPRLIATLVTSTGSGLTKIQDDQCCWPYENVPTCEEEQRVKVCKMLLCTKGSTRNRCKEPKVEGPLQSNAIIAMGAYGTSIAHTNLHILMTCRLILRSRKSSSKN